MRTSASSSPPFGPLRYRTHRRAAAAVIGAASLVAGSAFLHSAIGADGHVKEVARPMANSVSGSAKCVAPDTGQCLSPTPRAHSLDPTVANQIEEPTNDNWAAFLCGAGATAVALSYWNIDVLHYPKLSVTDPGGSTFTYDPNGSNPDTDGHGRPYIMYLATQTQPLNPPDPENWAGGGEVSFNAADVAKTGTNAESARDTLNWEASGHSSTWQNYFYTISYVNNPQQNTADKSPDARNVYPQTGQLSNSFIHAHIVADIGMGNHPVLAQVWDGDLPDWQANNIPRGGHMIAIIGYDDNTGQYTYVETCGKLCQTTGGPNGDGTGTHTIGQSQLYQAMTDFAGEGALIW